MQRVAYHVALKAHTKNARRQQHDAKATVSQATAPTCDDLSWGELRFDSARRVGGIAGTLAALVLCYLEGLTQEDSALVGLDGGDGEGAYPRGREKLRRRLERRGVGLAAADRRCCSHREDDGGIRRTFDWPLDDGDDDGRGRRAGAPVLRPVVSMKLAVLSAVLLSFGLAAGSIALPAA